MKNLYESILSSTNTGAHPRIEQWCDENIYKVGDEKAYEIDNNLRINSAKGKNEWSIPNVTINKELSSLPNIIKFGRIESTFFSRNFLKYATQDQLPTYAKYFEYYGSVEKLEDLSFNIGKLFSLSGDDKMLKHIKNVHINFEEKNNSKISFGNADLHLDDIKELHCDGCYHLMLNEMPAKTELLKQLKKLTEVKKGLLNDKAQDYLNEVFVNMVGLRFVNFSSRSSLELNPRDKKWYLF